MSFGIRGMDCLIAEQQGAFLCWGKLHQPLEQQAGNFLEGSQLLEHLCQVMADQVQLVLQ